jgi:hypothetical protein
MLAEQIVNEVLGDLHKRQGVGDELDMVEHDYPDIYADLKDELKGKVEALLEKELKPLQDKILDLELNGPHDED